MKSRSLAVFTLLLIGVAGLAQVNVTTSRNDNSRDGLNSNETILTPASVNPSSFGKLFSQAVEGYVYAQPLYVQNVTIPGLGTHNVVYVATEHDSVYAFDADSNTGMNSSALWKKSFIHPTRGVTTVSSGDVGCGDLIPEIGITGTPVIDTNTGTMYLIAKTKENGAFVQRLHAIDITTGAERPGSPKKISATVSGNGDESQNGKISFDPLREGQRSGLLLQNGVVFIGWASHCDNTPYHGWVMSYDATTLKRINVWNSTPNGGLGGVWQAGTGLAADDAGNLFIATGNGSYDGKSGGNDFSDSIVKLTPNSGAHFALTDWFTPYNQQDFSNRDVDVGSGGVFLLPDQGQGAHHQHLLLQVGKSGSIYLVDRDKMSHYHSTNKIVQDLEGAVGGMWATPGWWNNNVYLGGSWDYMRQYRFNTATGRLSLSAVATAPTYYNFPGPTPSLSANGTSDAIVWALQNENYGSGSSILHAYDATDISNELYNTGQNFARDDPGSAVKFTVPTVANGKVYVPAVQRLTVYGLLGGKRK